MLVKREMYATSRVVLMSNCCFVGTREDSDSIDSTVSTLECFKGLNRCKSCRFAQLQLPILHVDYLGDQ